SSQSPMHPGLLSFPTRRSSDLQIIQRCNTAIQKLQMISEADFPKKDVRIGEMKFLRGFVHFRLKQFFKYIPYIDETIVGSTADISEEHTSELQSRENLVCRLLL